jgi:hypothetical protein
MRPIISILMLAVCLCSCTDGKKAAEALAAQEAAKETELPPPATLEEAHEQLERLLPPGELAKIDAMRSEDEMIKYHRGIGMGMRNGWGLWKGGPLAKHMNKLGFYHPDDMSGVILETFWCKRHKKEFRLKERAAYYEAYWKAVKDPGETAKDPRDGSAVDWNMSFGAGDDKTPRQIHVGKSKATGRWLAYEYDKGVYVPDDEELLKQIEEGEAERLEGERLLREESRED